MEIKQILARVDHTLLDQRATWNEIKEVCDDGIKYNVASVCIPASYVKEASQYICGKISVCTVIGFPNGYDTSKAKIFMAEDAIENGASEVDMVINLGWLKDRRRDRLLNEINDVKKACAEKILKVIVETCLLSVEEKKIICNIVSESKADYIKTSTGFSTGGATKEDIKIFAMNKRPDLKIKASGGISSVQDARDFIDLGADRLGTSRIIKILKAN